MMWTYVGVDLGDGVPGEGGGEAEVAGPVAARAKEEEAARRHGQAERGERVVRALAQGVQVRGERPLVVGELAAEGEARLLARHTAVVGVQAGRVREHEGRAQLPDHLSESKDVWNESQSWKYVCELNRMET